MTFICLSVAVNHLALHYLLALVVPKLIILIVHHLLVLAVCKFIVLVHHKLNVLVVHHKLNVLIVHHLLVLVNCNFIVLVHLNQLRPIAYLILKMLKLTKGAEYLAGPSS